MDKNQIIALSFYSIVFAVLAATLYIPINIGVYYVAYSMAVFFVAAYTIAALAFLISYFVGNGELNEKVVLALKRIYPVRFIFDIAFVIILFNIGSIILGGILLISTFLMVSMKRYTFD